MKEKKLFDKTIIYLLIIFMIISIITLYSTIKFLNINMQNIVLKQFIYYLLGFLLIFIIQKIDKEKIIKYRYIIYIVNIILLALVLLIGDEINGAKAWINVPFFGSFQPSEFMKIGLILVLAFEVKNFNENKYQKDISLIIKAIILFLIPSILTFLEPDTGAIFVYFVITVVALFMSNIKKRWFVILAIIIFLLGGSLIYLYFYRQNDFISIFGNSFFYRFDRIIFWQKEEGMQLKNSLIGIASSGIFGKGINSIPIYFPELQTDFIFASFVSCFGLFGAFLLITITIIFDLKILFLNKNYDYKIISSCIFSVFLYQQIQNISMTIGLLPITGITLPLISYGGSSLLSFMILIGIFLKLAS